MHTKESELECPICYEVINKNNLCITKCGHNFHLDCLLKSTNTSECCPICRNILKEKNENENENDDFFENDENNYDNFYTYISHDYDGNNPLIIAAINGDNNYLRNLIKNNVELDKKDRCGKTALLWAVTKNQLESARILLKADSNPNILCYHDDTPLFISIYERNFEMLKLLLKNKNININLKNNRQQTALHIAVYNRYFDAIKLLVNYGCDTNIKDNKGNTALLMTSDFNIINYLLKKSNVDVNIKNNDNINILFQAIEYNNYYIVDKVLEKKININEKDNYGNTALIMAIYMNSIKFVKLFLNINNIDLTLKNIYGMTALDVALYKNKSKIVKLLQDKLNFIIVN
jgi:ankyrin repeat protein